jgi:hypothetical protein
MFGDDASAAPTKAATPSTPLPTTSNHRTVTPGHLCDRAAAAGLQTKQSHPPQPSRIDAPSRFGVLVTSAETMEDIPISNCNAEEGDGDGTSEGNNTPPSDAKASPESIIGVSFSHSNVCI